MTKVLRVGFFIAIGVVLGAGAAWAEPAEQAAEVKCQVAEVNPVTGHVFCIKPKGVPVGPPPEDIAPPCDADASRGQWSWEPTCRPVPKS